MDTQITLSPRATGDKVNAVITTRATGQMHDIVAVKIIENTPEAVQEFAAAHDFTVAGQQDATHYELAAR